MWWRVIPSLTMFASGKNVQNEIDTALQMMASILNHLNFYNLHSLRSEWVCVRQQKIISLWFPLNSNSYSVYIKMHVPRAAHTHYYYRIICIYSREHFSRHCSPLSAISLHNYIILHLKCAFFIHLQSEIEKYWIFSFINQLVSVWNLWQLIIKWKLNLNHSESVYGRVKETKRMPSNRKRKFQIFFALACSSVWKKGKKWRKKIEQHHLYQFPPIYSSNFLRANIVPETQRLRTTVSERRDQSMRREHDWLTMDAFCIYISEIRQTNVHSWRRFTWIRFTRMSIYVAWADHCRCVFSNSYHPQIRVKFFNFIFREGKHRIRRNQNLHLR